MYVTVPLLCMSLGKYLNFTVVLTGWTLHQLHTPFVLCVHCKVMKALAFALDVESR